MVSFGVYVIIVSCLEKITLTTILIRFALLRGVIRMSHALNGAVDTIDSIDFMVTQIMKHKPDLESQKIEQVKFVSLVKKINLLVTSLLEGLRRTIEQSMNVRLVSTLNLVLLDIV